jgi:hypothetical protein
LKKTLAHIATSQAYQSHAQIVTKETDDHGYTYAGPRAKRLTAEQFVDAIWQLTVSGHAELRRWHQTNHRDRQHLAMDRRRAR